MPRTAMFLIGAAVAVAMIVLGLWGWEHAGRLTVVAGVARPVIRSAVVTEVAAAQIVLLYAVGLMIPPGAFGRIVMKALIFVAGLGATSALLVAAN